MKTTKRLLCVVLIISVMLGLFAGCKKKDTAISFDENGNFVPTSELELTFWDTQGTDYTPTEQPKENIVEKWLEE